MFGSDEGRCMNQVLLNKHIRHRSTSPIRICVWTNMPNHYQSSLYRAIRELGVDLYVCYFGTIDASRVEMGWDSCEILAQGEFQCGQGLSILDNIPDWQNCIHILTSVSDSLRRGIIKRLCDEGVSWAFWDERGRPGLRWWLRYPFRRYFASKLNRHGLGAFAIAQWAISDFTRWGVDKRKISFLPYVCDPLDSTATPDSKIASFAGNRLTFLYCGVLSERKATDILLEAFSLIYPDDSKACLVLVGPDSSDGAYQRRCQRLGLRDHVLFRGAVKPESLASAMIRADVFVLPSRYDGWGVVLNEAASLGKPLIATDQCGAAFHLINPGENGYRVMAGDVAELAAAMKKYIASPALIEKHSKRSKEIFGDFLPRKIANSLLANLRRWVINQDDGEFNG
jgi:glycosyltransferase involved in cell wall biosynthesis